MIRVCLAFGNGLLLLICSALWASSARADYSINKDLVNLGPTADDIAVILQGSHDILGHYDGPYPDGITFSRFSIHDSGSTTKLHWQSPNEPIEPGQTIHVGWTTPEYSPILDMYWTDTTGHRIPGSVVYETAAHGSFDGQLFSVILDNFFVPKKRPPMPVIISNIQFAIVNTPWPLEDLNGANQQLMSQLQPLPQQFVLAPGQVVRFPLPVPPPPHCFVVLMYNVDTPDGTSSSVDFVQMDVLGQ